MLFAGYTLHDRKQKMWEKNCVYTVPRNYCGL